MIAIYRVLLADDEKLDLEGMRRFVPWSSLGLEVVEAVNSGFAALEVLEKEKVDILVTDVQMPNMTGLELARKAMDRWKDIRVIFVSGHQDFHYVKQALSMNACSYVLKPMDDRELTDSLVKITHELNMEQKQRETELAYREMVPIVKNELMLQLLEGSYDSKTLQVLSQQHGLNAIGWPARVAVLEADDLSWKLGVDNDPNKLVMLNEFSVEVMRHCEARNIPFGWRISKYRWALLLDNDGSSDSLEELITQTKALYSFSITIGYGGPAEDPEQIQGSYGQALQALDQKMFRGKGKLIEWEEVRAADKEQAESLNMQLDLLFSAMSQYELVRIHDEVDELFRLGMNMKSKSTVHNLAMYVILKLDDYLHDQNEDLFKVLGLQFGSLDIIQQFETVDDIRSWLTRKIFEISETLYLKKRNKNWKLIHEVVDYIKNRIRESITLREVADHFQFSPNYLGHLLKKETGKTFNEYVIALRMEKAGLLLKETKLKIYEVADAVGYRYMPYFSRQFREIYGMTPVEFKRRH